MRRPLHRSQRLLPPPSVPPTMTVVVDLSEPLHAFLTDAVSYPDSVQGGTPLDAQMTQTTPEDLLDIAVDIIGSIICEVATFHGIGYVDIANLSRHQVIRQAIFGEEHVPSIYNPAPTPTERYHLNVYEDQVSRALAAFYGSHAHSVKRDSHADILLWRVLTAIVLELAGAASHVGREKGLSEAALTAYHIDGIQPYGQVPYTYVMTLSGP